MITPLSIKAKKMPKKYKKARYAIRNVIKKDLLKIIREFEKLPYESYDKKRPKHERAESYSYLARQLEKFRMRADALNLDNYPVRTEMNSMKQIPTSQICYTEPAP